MIESIESMVAIMEAMNKEQKAQNELLMQRISGMEEQLRDSMDDVREMQEQIRVVNACISNVNRYMALILLVFISNS